MTYHKPKKIFEDGSFQFKKERESGRYPGNWAKIRKQVLIEQPLCRICELNGRIVLAQEVDHITPLRHGGDKISRSNLQALCIPCHRKKSAMENQSYSVEQMQREAESRLRLPPAP